MNNKTLIFEIGIEEIPSQYILTMAESLKDNTVDMFKDLKLDYSDLEVFYTPRRLVLKVNDLAEKQADTEETIKGPPIQIAYDQEGNPTKALLGFLKKNNKTVDDIYEFEDKKGKYIALDTVNEGIKTTNLLKDNLAKLINKIYNPNPMRWGSYSIKFIRPIRWLMALYGDEIIPVEIECTVASNKSRGHRVLANEEIPISNGDSYLNEMEEAFVIVDQNKRKDLILSQIEELEKEYGFKVEIDEDLLDEVTNIVEYPTSAVGKYDEKYLTLPECIIKEPLKSQQRYFPVFDNNGNITNHFIYTRNGNDYYLDNVTRGNERVLRPRLEDAEFFYNSDLNSTLLDKAEELKQVVFVDNGGSYYDKAERIQKIANNLAEQINYSEEELIKTAALLLKADLVSNVVREYTNIQGLVGGEFAKYENYDPKIITAISEQYLPNFYGDKLPSEKFSAILGIADKLDTIMCLFATGLIPSGSNDPYGLRRQALGIYNIALDQGFDIDLDSFIEQNIPLYQSILESQNINPEEFYNSLHDYLYQRLRIFLHDEKELPYEDIDKISISDLNITKSVKKAELIEEIREEPWYLDFLQIYNRIGRLIKNSKSTDSFNKGIQDKEAQEMFNSFYSKKQELIDLIDEENYEKAIRVISEIGKSINSFMEKYKALCDDETLRQNRVAFFNDFCDICSSIIQI